MRFTKLVDALADRTGIGEALAGAVLVGAVTSLPGLVTSVVGAADGDASFAVSNSLGGIAARTTFFALADLTYRRANLEHAAVTLLVAVRVGALTLAVGDILGGTFDVLFVAAADVAYREGSVYHAVDQGTRLVLGLVVLLTAVLAAGLVRRQEKGIGFEGFAILGLYVSGIVVVYAVS